MVPEVLEKLQSLQDILSKKYSIENELRDLPKSLQTKQEILNRLKKTYLEKNQQYESCRSRVTELKGLIETAGKDRESSEAMIVDISTQREYEALLKQIKDASDREQQYRRDLQREEKLHEELSAQLEKEEAMISQQETEFKQESEKIQAESNSRKKTIDSLDKEEQKLVSDEVLDSEILFKFRRIIRKKEGKGIVPLRKGVCTGCNMILPMEFVNEVRSADHIFFCPYCSMILYHEDSDDSYYNFDLTSFVSSHDDEEAFDDEELDEARLMEEEMKEGLYDDDLEEDAAEEDELVEDEADAEVVEDDDATDELGEDDLEDDSLPEDSDDDLDDDVIEDEE